MNPELINFLKELSTELREYNDNPEIDRIILNALINNLGKNDFDYLNARSYIDKMIPSLIKQYVKD